MGRYWQCPKCGAVLDKGPHHEAKTLIYMSPFSRTHGWVTCAGCHSSLSPRDVYGGKYDLAFDEGLSGRTIAASAQQRKSLASQKGSGGKSASARKGTLSGIRAFFQRCAKCGRMKMLGKGWKSQFGKRLYCPTCWAEVVEKRRARRQQTEKTRGRESMAKRRSRPQQPEKAHEGKSKRGRRTAETEARKLIRAILAVDLRQGAYERRQASLERLAGLGREALASVERAIDSVVSGSTAAHDFACAGELATVVGQIGGPDAFSLLIHYFILTSRMHEYEGMRAGAARGLGFLGDARAVRPLSNALSGGTKSDAVATAILEALERLGSQPPECVDSVLSRFVDGELAIAKPGLSFDAFGEAVSRLDKEDRSVAWWRLGSAVSRAGDERNAQKCFVTALTINADPDLLAWGCLRPPVDQVSQRNARTLKVLRQQIGTFGQ